MVLPGLRYLSDRRETLHHFRSVADASALPLMIYNNPLAYGVDMTPDMFAEIADEKKLVAIKESCGDVRRVTDLINAVGDRFAILCGVDNLAMEAILMGAHGWVAGLVCAFPRRDRGDLQAAESGTSRGGACDLPLVRAAAGARCVGEARAEHQAGRSDCRSGH